MQKVLRSMILEKFPFDLRVKLELLSRRRDIINKTKQEELLKLLREANIDDITQLGPGTNRYAFKMNGYVVKVATDHDGKIDNLKEMKMAKRLFPAVTKIYEVSENGTLLVAEYIQPFQSFTEMQRYADKIKNILNKISQVYLIGDVGIDAKNYSNWGLRVGSDDPVCLDFAYVYDAKSDLFICGKCNTGSMLVPNSDYTMLVCPNPLCGHKYYFEDIRGRMSNEVHMQEIGDLSKEAYRISESKVLTELTPDRSNYLRRKVIPEEKKQEEENKEEMEFDNFIYNKEDDKMAFIKATAFLANGNIYPKKKSQEDEIAFSGEITEDTNIIQATVVSVIPKDEPVEEEKVQPVVEVVQEEKKEETPAKVITEPKKEYEKPIPTPEARKSYTTPVIPAVNMVDDDTFILDAPIEETTEPAKEESVPIKAPVISEEFKENLNRCLSKFTNRIKDDLYHEEFWDTIKLEYMSSKAKPRPFGQFYDLVQSALFHSLAKFFRMKPVTQEDGKKQWICQEFENTEYTPTLIFLERWYSKKFINECNPASDGMEKYASKYTDYRGIQREWIPLFKKSLLDKLKDVDRDGIDLIVNKIAAVWCVKEETTAPVETETVQEAPKQVIDEKIEKAVKHLEEKGKIKVVDDMIYPAENTTEEEADEDDDMLAFSASVLEKLNNTQPAENNQEVDTELYTEEEDDEDDDEELNDLEVLIFPEENIDILRLRFSDTFGNIEIPLYKKLSDIDPKQTIPSMADDRNGCWDWLIHVVPDLRFITDDPDRWLELNDESVDDTVRFVILDNDYKGHVLMAMYAINGIFTVDDNGNRTVESNMDILKQLNILFTTEIGNGAISHYIRNITDDDLIRDEAYAKMVLNGYLPDEEATDEPEEEPEEAAEEEAVIDTDDGEELGILNAIPRRYN